MIFKKNVFILPAFLIHSSPRHSNAALLAENDMFESFICRLDPQDLLSQAGGEGAGATRSLKLGAGVSTIKVY